MHDLVRDVALWIAKKEIHVIMGPKMDTKALIEDTNIKDKIRFLYCHNINEFPDQLDCPNLEILYAYKDGKGSFQVPNSLFKEMKELKVLTLHYHRLSKGPPSLLSTQSIHCLTNLRTLCLRGYRLDDISFLGNLERLETLEMCNCMINALPNEIAEQRKLRLLDVSLCNIGGNPYEVLGRCSQLEELYFIKNDLPEELLNDQNLAKFFHKNSSSHRLQRYRLDIGSYNYKFKGDRRSKFLSLNHFDVSTSSAAIKDLVQRAEILFLRKIRGCKNIFPDMVQIQGGGTNDLVELHLDSSEEMECLIDTTNLLQVGIVYSNLVRLRITWMKHLKALCRGPPPLGLFEKLEELRLAQCSQLNSILTSEKLNLRCLKVLKLENCPMLTSLFSPAVAQSLGLLEVLKIRHCDGLKHIMTDEDAEIILDDNGEQSYRSVFSKLKRLIVKWCGKLECLIPVSFSNGLVRLEYLEIDKAPELKYVFHNDQLSSQQNELHIIELPVLKSLKLLHLPNIINICPESYHPVWPSLQDLYLLQCPQLNIMSVNNSIVSLTSRQQGHREELMPLVVHSSQVVNGVSPILTLQNLERLVVGHCKIEGIFQLTGLPINRVLDPLTSCLHQLSLENLPELSYIFRGPLQVFILPNLTELSVHGCRKLKSIFSACIAGSLPHLEVLDIKHCDQLEQIIEDEEQQDRLNHCKESNEVEITRISAPLEDLTHGHKNTGPFNLHNLKQLKLASCSMLRSLFTPSTAKTLTSLQYMTIEECHGLKFIVTEEAAQENNREEIVEDHEAKSYVLFPKLQVLRVEKCDLLEYIFPVSFAQGLVELKNMVICETPQIKYIFGESNLEEYSYNKSKNQIQIQLPVLTEFCLRGLCNIISICPERFYVACLSLRRFSLDSLGLPLPNMSPNNLISSKATHRRCTYSQESLEEVQDLQTIENSGRLSLCNCKIEAIFQIEGPSVNKEQDPLTLSLSYLDLHNLPELRHIWKGPLQLLNLENLIELSVVECQKLKFIFSSSVLRSLPQLMSLTVKHCELLVKIIEEDEGDTNFLAYNFQHVCFPRLEILDIQQCNNMKCLFSISSPHELPQLQYLFIEDCCQLEKVFGGEECEIKQEQALLLPSLECLRLRKLPNLIDICQGFKLKSVYHEVEDCLRLTSAAAATLKILPQEHQDPEEEGRKESKEEMKGNKGKKKLIMEETNAIDLTKNSIGSIEVHTGPASSYTSSVDTGFNTNKATETNFDWPKVDEDYILQGLEDDSKTKRLHENFNHGVASSDSPPTVSSLNGQASLPPAHAPPAEVDSLDSSSGQLVMTPTEEYAAFRDIGAIKERHIPLLEQAIASYPSLWSWREKFMRPKMREFGYASLGDMLEFLTLTRWGDLTETKKAEFESLVCELEAFGFDIQWLRNKETMIKQRKINKETIDLVKTLEVQVNEQEAVVEDLEVRLKMAKVELANTKSELGSIRLELGNLNDFIGF